MEQSPLKNKIVCRLQAEHAENTGDSEITRCLSGCIAAPGLIRDALKMRNAGILTSEDILQSEVIKS